MKPLVSGAFLLVVIAFPIKAQTNAPTTAATNSVNQTATDTLIAPAVSELNGKIAFAGGRMESSEAYNFDGSVAFPLSRSFGFQADALYSRIGGEDFYGGAGHVFWRKPDFGLIGFTGGYLASEGVNTFQVGAEGEYYFKRITFGLFAGVGSIDYDITAPFIDSSPTRFVGSVSAYYYPWDNVRVGVVYVTAFHDNLVKGEAEYLTPIRGLALTAEVAAGDNDYDHWLLGVRYYFGGNKTLRDRHRNDDPASLMPQILHGLGLYGAEFNQQGEAYVNTLNPSLPNSGDAGYQWTSGYGVTITRLTDGGTIVFPPLPPPPPTP